MLFVEVLTTVFIHFSKNNEMSDVSYCQNYIYTYILKNYSSYWMKHAYPGRKLDKLLSSYVMKDWN